MFFDTHAHPYLATKKSQASILENYFSQNGEYLNTVSVDIPSCQTNVQLSEKYAWVYTTIWIHPSYVLQYKNTITETISFIRTLILNNRDKIIAIGETWLDYYWLEKMSSESGIPQEEIIQVQKDFFRAQITLANELDLPVVIHNREASEDIFTILVEEHCNNFVFHCYSEDYTFAQKLIAFAPNCMLGFGGIMTFKSAWDIQHTAQKIPLKNIILETDSPYLTPIPYRWKEENEPLYVKYVLEKLVELRSEWHEIIQQQVFNNAIIFFDISKNK